MSKAENPDSDTELDTKVEQLQSIVEAKQQQLDEVGADA